MGVIGRTVSMIAGALALLLALGVADPGNKHLMSSFFSEGPLPGVLPKGAFDGAAIVRTIARFNDELAAAHLASDAARMAPVPMSEELRRNIAEDIKFLRNDGRALDMAIGNIDISEVRRLENHMFSVTTTESMALRYLKSAGRGEILAHPESRYTMNYRLERAGSEWKVVAVETLEAGGRGD